MIINTITSIGDIGGMSFFAQIINWLVGITSSVAVGIILFTVLLKLITFPFDFISRSSMRKNSLKMEKMRPELEKLQKQYANDKALYNQKMMALYKKNGYSMFGACLPTIITLVIFIIAINGFTNYSQFQNRKYLQDMAYAYNNVIYSGVEVDNDYIVRNADGSLTFKYDELMDVLEDNSAIGTGTEVSIPNTTIKVKSTNEVVNDKEVNTLYVITNGILEHRVSYSLKDGTTNEYKFASPSYFVTDATITALENNEDYKYNGKTFVLDTSANAVEPTKQARTFIENICSEASAKTFRSNKASFLWVKNIWEKDSPLDHPVQTDYKAFNSNQGSNVSETDYNKLIKNLEAERNQPNGYFILCILTAGMSFLMQFVSSKSNKAQMELQTVDGQGAKTQKMMMWLMPIMMAVFSFIYTASFSIYMVLSSAISIGTTLLINKIIDIKFKKANGDDAQAEAVIRGRVYTPKEEEKPKKEKKKKKKPEDDQGDFISGPKKVKHPRGRIK